MNKYKIEYRISTVAECMVMENLNRPTSFTVLDLNFSHWDFSFVEGCIADAWLIKCIIEAENFNNAYQVFYNKLRQIIPRIALIVQSYIDYSEDPFLIHREESEVVYFEYSKSIPAVGLTFIEQDKKA